MKCNAFTYAVHASAASLFATTQYPATLSCSNALNLLLSKAISCFHKRSPSSHAPATAEVLLQRSGA